MPKKADWTINSIEPERFYMIKPLSKLSNISDATIYNWVKSGWLIKDYRNLVKGEDFIALVEARAWLSSDKRNRFTQSKAKQRHRERYPERERAIVIVRKAIKTGILVKKPCEICKSTDQIEAHHDDYFKPMEVRWLCRAHHLEYHKKHPNTNNVYNSKKKAVQ